MKIVFTGGGTGGHFYPIISVVEEIHTIVDAKDLIKPEMYYVSNSQYDEAALFKNKLQYQHVFAGKLRRYFSIQNGFDFFKTLIGLPRALNVLFKIYPDVVFSKGGYVSVPVVFAARILRIPVFVHDSDAIPGRANLWAGKFAKRIAVSYPEAVEYFKHKDRVAYIGNPIRKSVATPVVQGSHDYFNFLPTIQTILILGGSQGAERINNTLHSALSDLLENYQVIHQIGKENFDAYKELVDVELHGHAHIERYRAFPFLNETELRNAAGCADLVVSRAGSGSIFEIASWGKPSILVPIPENVSRDQRRNAYAYARSGATEVIEQENFTPHVLNSEIERILSDTKLTDAMKAGAKAFARPDASHKLAVELITMMLEHEK